MHHRQSKTAGASGPSAASIAVLLFALFFSCATLAFVGNVSMEIESLREQSDQTQNPKMQELVTTWTDASGTTHTVTTKQRQGESDTAFRERHNATVVAQQEVFPPVT